MNTNEKAIDTAASKLAANTIQNQAMKLRNIESIVFRSGLSNSDRITILKLLFSDMYSEERVMGVARDISGHRNELKALFEQAFRS